MRRRISYCLIMFFLSIALTSKGQQWGPWITLHEEYINGTPHRIQVSFRYVDCGSLGRHSAWRINNEIYRENADVKADVAFTNCLGQSEILHLYIPLTDTGINNDPGQWFSASGPPGQPYNIKYSELKPHENKRPDYRVDDNSPISVYNDDLNDIRKSDKTYKRTIKEDDEALTKFNNSIESIGNTLIDDEERKIQKIRRERKQREQDYKDGIRRDEEREQREYEKEQRAARERAEERKFAAEERQRKLKAEQDEAERRRIAEEAERNRRLAIEKQKEIENNVRRQREITLDTIQDGKFPSNKSQLTEVWFYIVAWDKITYYSFDVYISDIIKVKKYSDGTWPFLVDVKDNINTRVEWGNTGKRLVGYFANFNDATQKQNTLLTKLRSLNADITLFKCPELYRIENLSAEKKSKNSDFWNEKQKDDLHKKNNDDFWNK